MQVEAVGQKATGDLQDQVTEGLSIMIRSLVFILSTIRKHLVL
jgi:hypothetical protein